MRTARTRGLASFAAVVLLPAAAVATGCGAATTRNAAAGHATASAALTAPGAAGRNAAGLAMTFTRNQGQSPPSVVYAGQGPGITILFTDTAATVELTREPSHRGAAPTMPALPTAQASTLAAAKPTLSLSLRFLHANPHPRITGADRSPGLVSYLHGADPAGWRTGIAAFGQVVYHELWPGIDVVFSARNGVLKYSFMLAAGANPSDIQLSYAGARSLAVDAAGALAITAPGTVLRDQAPTAHQVTGANGGSRPLTTSYRMLGATGFGFTVGSHKPGVPMVIDPGLDYAGYLGGSQDDWSFSIDGDAAGDLYVFGTAQSPDFPVTAGAFQRALNDGGAAPGDTDDFFVSKFDPSGSKLIYSTFIGGTGMEINSYGVVDTHGDAYVAGGTLSKDFPVTNGAFRRQPYPSQLQSVVFKLNPAGSGLVYSTYLAPDTEPGGFGKQIALAPGGSVIVTASTTSDYAPTTPGAFQARYPGGHVQSYVARLDAAGARLIFATYLGVPVTGGPEREVDCSMQAMTVDARGATYAGLQCSPGFPTTPGAYQANPGGPSDQGALLVKLDPTGGRLDYATYYGSASAIIRPDAVAVDGSGSAYLAADTPYGDAPVTPGAFSSGCGGPDTSGYCTAVAEFNPSGTGLVYSTYFGGNDDNGDYDSPEGLTVDSAGRAYVVGIAAANDLPTTPDAYAPTSGGYYSPFYLAVFGKGNLLYATYFGGAGPTACVSILCGLDTGFITIAPQTGSGNVRIGGFTSADDMPTSTGAYQTVNRSRSDLNQDVWVAELALPRLGPAAK